MGFYLNHISAIRDIEIFCSAHELVQGFRVALFNPLSANFLKWSNTLKQFVANLPTNCLSVFDHFKKLALKGLSTVTN